jgi:diguanylate cyclase (GGDEF)-like protein
MGTARADHPPVRRSGAFLVTCALVLAAIAVSSSLWLTSNVRHAMVGQLTRAESIAASERSAQIGSALDAARARLAVGAALPAAARAVASGDLSSLIPALHEASHGAGVVRMSVTSGDRVLATLPDGTLYEPAGLFSYFVMSPSHTHIVITAPIHDAGGAVVGAVNAELDLAGLVPQLVQPFEDEQGSTILAATDGTVLVTNERNQSARVDNPELLELIADGRPGTASFHSSGLRSDRIVTAAPVAGYPWMVVVGADSAAAGSPADRLYRRIQVGLALSAFLAILVLGAAAVSVTRTRRGLLVDRQVAEEAALRDGLTGLLNRRALEGRLAQLRGSDGQIGVIMLDVDKLKEINDSYGHAVGDEALRLAATALRETTRAGERAYRFGGDEFIVLVDGVDQEELARVADRVRVSIGAHEVLGLTRLTAAVGWAFGPAAGIDGLVTTADTSLYTAKAAQAVAAGR